MNKLLLKIEKTVIFLVQYIFLQNTRVFYLNIFNFNLILRGKNELFKKLNLTISNSKIDYKRNYENSFNYKITLSLFCTPSNLNVYYLSLII